MTSTISVVKTTFDIPEALLREVQTLARERKTTTKSLVEEALRRLLEDAAHAVPFVLEDARFTGKPGFTPEFENATWQQILDASYELEDR